MSTRLEREKKQVQNDHYKKVLAQLIAKEENKFCADCLAKSPRWVSWNLGVLLCIRCSGIHRSLGVHISKVKSVNLDTWNSDQLVNMCRRGNGWAKDNYEASLPKGFKRPHSDSSLEYFIRDKYEKRKYCSSTEVPFRSIDEYNIFMDSPSSKPRSREKKKDLGNGVPIIGSIKSSPKPVEKNVQPPLIISEPAKQPVPAANTNSAMDDLLGLNTPVVTAASAPPTSQYQPSNDLTNLFDSMQSHTNPTSEPSTADTQPSQNTPASTQMTKDSILSLYSQNQPMNMQQSPYASAGAYNMSGPPTSMYSNMAGMPNMGVHQQPNMQQGGMAMQQQPMQGFPQQQQYNWQQQQMQQQMHNMHLSGAQSNVHYGGLRSCSSMPQMSHQQGGAMFGGQMQQGSSGGFLTAPMHGNLASSQPSLTGQQSNMGSWNASQGQSGGQTLSNQLWK